MDFDEFVMQNESVIRLAFFFGIFAVMAVWELIAPRRALTVSKVIRWTNNLGLVFFNRFILWLIIPTTAVGVAVFTTANGWGVLNYYSLPIALAVVLAVVAMDFVIYLQHVLVHAVSGFVASAPGSSCRP